MNPLIHPAGIIFQRVLQTTWQAAVLAGLILGAQWFLRKRLSPSWRYGLWLLLVVRLLMPVSPQSAFSIFNLARATPKYPLAASHASVLSDAVEGEPAGNIPAYVPVVAEPHGASLIVQAPAVAKPAAKVNWFAVAFYGWLAGVFFFGARLVWTNGRFLSRIAAYQPIADEAVTRLFDECRAAFKITHPVRIIESEEVESPAVYGLWRKWLLLPDGVFERFTTEELRCIFLHELAHIKRGDLGVNWLVALLQVLHWFNPVLWLAWARMRADRELATDALALAHVRKSNHASYGETILKVLEGLTGERALPGLVGVVENKAQLKERLAAISRPGKYWKWAALAVMALIAGVGLTGAQAEKGGASENPKPAPTDAANIARLDLTGEVRMTNGKPIMATVFIATARPKTGTSPFCPSCYADCIKSAKADVQGRFKIESLDPTLIFRILVVAKDYEPKYVGEVDPAKGPVKVELESRNLADAPPGNTLLGRVVDSQGRPIAGATVESFGIHTKDGAGHWGSLPGVDPLAVTDDRGVFLITSLKPFAALDVKVEARGFARKSFTELRSGTTRHDLTMTEGAMVSGRIIWHGKPLPGVSVGIASTDRSMEHFTGHFEVGTDSDGRFAFINLPPHVQYNLYGIMQTLQNYGAVVSSQVSTEGDGSKVDAGDLVVDPAHRLAGRVVLDDGKPFPAKTRLLVSLEAAWDSLHIELDQDGHFDTTGIPSGVVSLSVRVPGYRVSAKNASLDTLNPFMLSGRVN